MASQRLSAFLQTNLSALKAEGLYNTIEPLESPNGPIILIQGKEFINLSSNNYLGLAMDKRLIEAANQATNSFGAGSGAVRSINGTLRVHEELEIRLARFKGTEAVLTYQSGFNCNMAAISAVMGPDDLILSDELNHASIIDGCRLSRATVLRYAHSDMDDLRTKANEARKHGKYEKIMVITDGVFSMDGDIARLPDIVEIANEYDLITYVDDAHGSGVLEKVKARSNTLDYQTRSICRSVHYLKQ